MSDKPPRVRCNGIKVDGTRCKKEFVTWNEEYNCGRHGTNSPGCVFRPSKYILDYEPIGKSNLSDFVVPDDDIEYDESSSDDDSDSDSTSESDSASDSDSASESESDDDNQRPRYKRLRKGNSNDEPEPKKRRLL